MIFSAMMAAMTGIFEAAPGKRQFSGRAKDPVILAMKTAGCVGGYSCEQIHFYCEGQLLGTVDVPMNEKHAWDKGVPTPVRVMGKIAQGGEM